MAWWNVIVAPIAKLFTKALDIVDEYVEDKDLAAKLKNELQMKMIDLANTELMALLEARTKTVLGEITGESWLQRSWRPIVMLMFATVVANNYIIAPMIYGIFGVNVMIYVPQDAMPQGLWAALQLGLTGYIVGRSAEKIADGGGIKGIINNLKNGK